MTKWDFHATSRPEQLRTVGEISLLGEARLRPRDPRSEYSGHLFEPFSYKNLSTQSVNIINFNKKN